MNILSHIPTLYHCTRAMHGFCWLHKVNELYCTKTKNCSYKKKCYFYIFGEISFVKYPSRMFMAMSVTVLLGVKPS